MTYELAKELKDAGFPVRLVLGATEWNGEKVFFDGKTLNDGQKIGFLPPTLAELIEACLKVKAYPQFQRIGDEFYLTHDEEWKTGFHFLDIDSQMYMGQPEACGNTPEEAVARLWLALNKKE